jgi:hypothetical protein
VKFEVAMYFDAMKGNIIIKFSKGEDFLVKFYNGNHLIIYFISHFFNLLVFGSSIVFHATIDCFCMFLSSCQLDDIMTQVDPINRTESPLPSPLEITENRRVASLRSFSPVKCLDIPKIDKPSSMNESQFVDSCISLVRWMQSDPAKAVSAMLFSMPRILASFSNHMKGTASSIGLEEKIEEEKRKRMKESLQNLYTILCSLATQSINLLAEGWFWEKQVDSQAHFVFADADKLGSEPTDRTVRVPFSCTSIQESNSWGIFVNEEDIDQNQAENNEANNKMRQALVYSSSEDLMNILFTSLSCIFCHSSYKGILNEKAVDQCIIRPVLSRPGSTRDIPAFAFLQHDEAFEAISYVNSLLRANHKFVDAMKVLSTILNDKSMASEVNFAGSVMSIAQTQSESCLDRFRQRSLPKIPTETSQSDFNSKSTNDIDDKTTSATSCRNSWKQSVSHAFINDEEQWQKLPLFAASKDKKNKINSLASHHKDDILAYANQFLIISSQVEAK